MKLEKPQLAEDWDRAKAQFPVIAQPKYDGVRALNLFGRLTARSLRPFDNKFAQRFFSQSAFLGLDGEMAAGPEGAEDLCRLTTSSLSTIAGEPWLLWHCFDYLTPNTVDLPYTMRYGLLSEQINKIKEMFPELGAHIQIMPSTFVTTMGQLEELMAEHCSAGYEGTIVRDGKCIHKNGRSSPKHGGLLRIKPFIEVDAIVLKIYEGQRNENEAKTNRLGHTERSTHQENMVPNGMVGAMDAELLEDAYHPLTRALVHRKGEMVRFSAGRLDHDERRLYFQQQHLLNGKRIKGQIFPHGVKDKPRFPTFQGFRMDQDAVNK